MPKLVYILYMVVVLALVAACGMIMLGCKRASEESKVPAASGPELKSGAAQTEQTICPVMGGPVSKNTYVDYGGRRVYFCCPSCAAEFKKDPGKYLRKLDEQLGQKG